MDMNKCLCGHGKNVHFGGDGHCLECYDVHLMQEKCSVFVSESKYEKPMTEEHNHWDQFHTRIVGRPLTNNGKEKTFKEFLENVCIEDGFVFHVVELKYPTTYPNFVVKSE